MATKKNDEKKARLLGVTELEEMTGVSRWTWRRWAYDGRLESVKLGKRLLIPASAVEGMISENTRPRLAAFDGKHKASDRL